MKRRILFVENFAKVENVIIRDLSNEYGLDERAARIMQQVEDLVSENLLNNLIDCLLSFCDQMQVELAEDILDFALAHVVHTTGCKSADYILDYCYTCIALEHDIMVELEN
jgi:hypothetical protein